MGSTGQPPSPFLGQGVHENGLGKDNRHLCRNRRLAADSFSPWTLTFAFSK